MNKNITIAVLLVLLIGSVGWGWPLQQGKTKLQDRIKTLESEKATLESGKAALQDKIVKGLAYAKSLDLLLDPFRKQMSLPIKQNLSETEWLLALTEATKATADSELQNNLNDIKKGGNTAQKATALFMEHAISATANTFK